MDTRTCKNCGETKPLEEGFYRNNQSRLSRLSVCKACVIERQRTYRSHHPARKRAYDRDHNLKPEIREKRQHQRLVWKLRSQYGLELEQYEAMLSMGCQICGADPVEAKLCVDHDHETGEVRGMLCGRCNSALGMLDDDVGRVQAALAYLSATGRH